MAPSRPSAACPSPRPAASCHTPCLGNPSFGLVKAASTMSGLSRGACIYIYIHRIHICAYIYICIYVPASLLFKARLPLKCLNRSGGCWNYGYLQLRHPKITVVRLDVRARDPSQEDVHAVQNYCRHDMNLCCIKNHLRIQRAMYFSPLQVCK